MGETKMVQRKEWASYMNTGSAAAPVWSRIGEGFTELEMSMGAQTYSRHYVHEKTERKDVTGYATAIAYQCDVYSGDPVIERIGRVMDEELVGADAQVDIVNVSYFKPVDGGHEAYLRRWAIIPDTKGAGAEALTMSGLFAAVGDAAPGVFTEAAGFVPAG